MAECILRNSRVIGSGAPPYIVAEVNTGHSGDVAAAKLMVDRAKEAGCDCVKFQSWSAESINSKDFYKENPIAKRFFVKFAFNNDAILEIADYCQSIGISFSSTVYSAAEVDFLVKNCNAPFVKIASMEINNYPFIEYIAKTGAPIILSTGMADMGEINRAVEVIERTGNKNLCLLHCISIYPPETADINLLNITGLRKAFPEYAIGFSDHSLGIELAPAAVALGASVIEKHLTLDKTKIGMDNQMAILPGEMARMARNCHNVHLAMGGEERVVSEAELAQRKRMRRSIVAARDIKEGEVFAEADLGCKRPGTGFPPEKIAEIVGKRAACDIEADTLLTLDDVVW
jgi:N-acetylneuraminate synthase